MMKKIALFVVSGFLAVAGFGRVDVFPQTFEAGGWSLDCQFMDIMGSPYLLAHGIGRPVTDARATITLPSAGEYRVWVRSRNWAEGAPGRFDVRIDGKALGKTFGAARADDALVVTAVSRPPLKCNAPHRMSVWLPPPFSKVYHANTKI